MQCERKWETIRYRYEKYYDIYLFKSVNCIVSLSNGITRSIDKVNEDQKRKKGETFKNMTIHHI